MAYEAGPHDFWLRHEALPQLTSRPTQVSFESNYEAVPATKARRDPLDAEIEDMAEHSEFTAMVHRPGCLRGIGTLTGFALAVEIGDWHRFTDNSIGSFVGLVPTEHSSGNTRSQGSMTKTGNAHLRRLLVEAAWNHRPSYRIGKTMRDRWALAPAAARAAPSPMSRSPESSRAGAGPWPSWTDQHIPRPLRRHAAGGSARSDPRRLYEQTTRSTLVSRQAVPLQPNHRPAVSNPRISV